MSEPIDDEPLATGLLEAYEVPPPTGLADRVLVGLRRSRAARTRRLIMGGIVAIAAAVAVFITVRQPSRRAFGGSLVATTQQSFAIGTRAVAVAEAGAQLSWRGDDASVRVEQALGTVRYRVAPGGPFVVATPAGEVTVVGTLFTVEVGPMHSWMAKILATSSAAMATLVTVHEGRVLLANGAGQVAVAAGGQAVAAADAAPTMVPAQEGSHAGAASGVRRITAERRAELLASIASVRSAKAEGADGRHPGERVAAMKEREPDGDVDVDYLRRQVRDLLPLIQECYEHELEKDSALAGTLTVRFTIGGEPGVGGVVEESEVEDSGIGKNAALAECVRETMFALELDSPLGGGQFKVTYPFTFLREAPADEDSGDDSQSDPGEEDRNCHGCQIFDPKSNQVRCEPCGDNSSDHATEGDNEDDDTSDGQVYVQDTLASDKGTTSIKTILPAPTTKKKPRAR